MSFLTITKYLFPIPFSWSLSFPHTSTSSSLSCHSASFSEVNISVFYPLLPRMIWGHSAGFGSLSAAQHLVTVWWTDSRSLASFGPDCQRNSLTHSVKIRDNWKLALVCFFIWQLPGSIIRAKSTSRVRVFELIFYDNYVTFEHIFEKII